MNEANNKNRLNFLRSKNVFFLINNTTELYLKHCNYQGTKMATRRTKRSKRKTPVKRRRLSGRALSFKQAAKFFPGEMKVLMSQTTKTLNDLVRLCKENKLPWKFCGRKPGYRQRKRKNKTSATSV